MSENKGAAPQQEKSVGTILREARQARNLSLEQTSRTTHIHVNVLKALEADEVGRLGVVYTRSFLRLYADFLGLNKDEIVERFIAVTPEAAASVNKVLPSAPRRILPVVRLTGKIGRNLWVLVQRGARRVPWQRVAVGVLALVFLFGMGRWIKGCRARGRERRAAAVSAAPSGARGRAASASSRISAATKKSEQRVVLVVRAVDKTWLQVKADGKIIFQSVLAKGSSESWQAEEQIELWIGDAGALELEVNGRFLGHIGRPGQTLKEVVITPKGLIVRG